MSHTQQTIRGAIERSITHDEIVYVQCSEIEPAYYTMVGAIDPDDDYDHTETADANGRRVWEAWGKFEGDDWRVHFVEIGPVSGLASYSDE